MTAEDAVCYAISQVKIAELRRLLDASEAEGGGHTTSVARQFVRQHLDREGVAKRDS
jgi:hypothetical protein